MSKYRKPSEELVTLFNEVLNKTSIPQWVEFEILCYEKLNELYKISKLNDAIEEITKLNFLVIINDEIFDSLDGQQQYIVLDECLSGISVNENDVISIKKPDITTYSGVLQKYGDNKVISLKESIASLFDQKREKEEQSKQSNKQNRSKG